MSPKIDKKDNRGAILIEGYFGYYCGGLLYFNISVWFHFYCFVDWVFLFTSPETNLHWSDRHLPGYLHCYASGLFSGYSDSLVFLLIDSLSTKPETA